MSAVAPDSSCGGHDRATPRPSSWASTWPPDGCGGDRGHPTKLAVRYVRACAEHLPFTHDVFDLVFATLSLRHWTNPSAGIAEISRVLIPGGMLVVADVFPDQRHRSSARPRVRHLHAAVPTDLGRLLAAHRLTVIGCDRTSWFRLPDVQVIASASPHRRVSNLLP